MKAKTTLFISILFLFIGNIYSQNSEDLDNLGDPVYVGNVKPFSIPSSAKTKTLKTSTQTLKSFATSQTNIEWPNPGAVHIEKTAEATTTLGKWKINVLVQGKNVPKTTDVVLVIDNSGSMVGPRITSAIAAANTFVNEILTQSIDIRVAIVTINGTAVGVPTVNQGFTDDAALLNTAISSITAHDGTNLQGGFYAARQLMNSSTASRKAVILLSDGNPTYSYSSAVTTDWLLSCGNINDFNISDIDFEESHLTVTSSNYSSVSGDGQNFGTELYSQTIRCNNTDRTFIAGHHGLPTKYEARLLIDSGVDVYTIGFEVLPGGIAEKTLSGSQNKGYFTATTSNIESVYSQIRSNIAYAATNAVFSDPMSTYIVLNSNIVPTYSTFPNSTGDVVVSKGTVAFSNNGYVLNDPDIPGSGNSSLIKWKITWNIGTVSELGDQMYYFVDMAPNITPSVLYDANEQTYMDYTDVNGNTNAHQQTPEHFTIPKVSGGKGSIEIYYYTVNEAGQPINSSGTVVPVENAVKLIPGNSTYFVFNGSTALDLNQAYTVEPESAYSSNSILYQLYCTFGNVSITPTSADPNKKVWFGYIVSTPPIAADVQYCLNKTAAPLTASLSGGHTSPNYILYYFDSLNGPAQTAITPSTAVAGQTTYYVAEGKSLTCFGEKVPITVTIYPEITVSAGTPFTKTCTANINGASIGETAVTGNTYSWTSVPVGFTSADANPTVNPDQTTVYTVVKTNSASGCTATANVTVTVDNSPITVSAGNSFTKTCTANTAGASIGETAVTGNTYSWTSVPAGFTSADANPTVNPDQTTVYTVVKTNTANDCTATANVTATVDNSPITVSAGNPFTKTCATNTAGASIGETAVTGNTYSWSSVPAGFSSAEANPMVNPDQTTVYTVVKTNTTSGCTATANVTATVDNSPITVSARNPFTKTCTANTTGASIGETAVAENTYSWTSVPVGFSSADANPTVNPDQTTVYTVVKTNIASGCTATASVTVTIDNSPITVNAGNPFTKTCNDNTAGSSIGETAVIGNIYSWTSVPAGFTSTEANPIVNPDQTTVYTVVKTNTASGCTATANVTVTVDNSPITVSAGNSFTKTCTANTAGTSIGETAVAENTYSWTSVPTGFSSADANPTVNPDQTTVYTVVKTNTASGCTATAKVTVTVDNSPITVSAGNPFTKTCTANTAGASIGETAVGGNIYSWTSVPAGFTSTEANPIVNPDQTTIYTVIKTNSASGCTATASVTITVDNSPIIVSAGTPFTKTCTANINGASIGETAMIGNTYSWTSVPAGFTSAEANPIVNPDQTTVYTVVKTNTASGCTAIANVTVTVDNSPITVSVGNPFTKTCTTNTAGSSIGETAVAGNTYSWTSVPAGFSSADASPIVNPDQTTVYTVVKTNSTSGCTATANVTAMVNTDIPTLTISNPLVVCSPATVDITSNKIQTTNNGTTTKYYTTLELANLGGVSDLTTPSAINSSGIYYIRSEFTNGCFIVKAVEVSINVCSIALVKQSELHNTGNCTAVGDKITYTFTITNPGTTPITNITITDPLLASPNPYVPILYVSGDTNSDDSLNSSETWTYKADYSVNQSDINVGKITNQAAVNGLVLGTNTISSFSGTDVTNHNPTITELCQSPSIKITKDGNYVDSNQDGITNVGDIVSYNFVIENTGNVPLTNITVTDNNAVITTGSIATLAVGAIDTNTFSGSHAITQDDINIGYVYNLAIVTAKDPNDNPVTDTSSDPTPCTTCPIDPKCPDCTITPLTQSPGLIVIKTAVTESYSKVGDIINYTIIVKNTGNQTLHQIIVKDPLTSLNTTIAILEPNASSEYSQSYIVTQNDLDKGSVTNVATADGLTPNGTPISASDDEIVKEKTNPIDAVDDSAGPRDGINGAVNVLNVFNNDTLNAIAVNPADVKLTLVTPDATGFMTMNTDGSIDLKDGTPAGIYTLVYQICENADLGNCDTATVTITVICNNTAKISGHVLNLGTNTPLANVPVTLIPQKNTTGPILIRITDTQGYYNFTGMIPSDYLVQVQDANLNSAYGLYPVNSSLFFTTLESCKYQSHDFGYDKSDLPVLGDFVWYDVNNNGIQDEWFDANNDNLVTKNIPNQDGSFDYSKWEWIDLNGDGSYTGTLNVGELNAAGFGNAKSENIFVTGPNSYSDKVIIGIQGFWRNRPDAGAYGDYIVELKMDANLEAQASAMGATGLVKVLPSDSKKTRLSKIAKPASVEICGLTNENPQTAAVTAADQVHLDLDFGISCKMFANIHAVDDVYNVTQCSIADEIRNAVTNDLLDGLPAPISAFKFKLLTSLPQDIDINIDETGSISFLNGVAAGQYIFDYEVCEAINPANCATATITINVAPIEPITLAGPVACNGDTTPVDLSKYLPEGTPTTGTWNDTDNTRGLVGNILSTAGIPISTYKFEYKLEGECPRSIFLNVEINDDCAPLACKAIIIHNAVSANEDNKNDYFEIENLESNDCYKNFKVEIFNRWGVLVFERENYNNDANAFRGRSEGRTTINKNEGLPTGTYFYIVSYDTVDGVGKTLSIKKDGYLYLVNK